MCGRYVITVTLDDLQERYHAARATGGDAIPCYNIAPSMNMPVVGEGADDERGFGRCGGVSGRTGRRAGE